MSEDSCRGAINEWLRRLAAAAWHNHAPHPWIFALKTPNGELIESSKNQIIMDTLGAQPLSYPALFSCTDSVGNDVGRPLLLASPSEAFEIERAIQ